ncbi:MAG: hypothetical protein LBC23_02040, partial [Coriobacteriales bacterium]|nr:hypothetical protein [Coriobacteriales bacterium]
MMVVILVLVIVLGAGLAAASGSFGLSSLRHAQQQARYTALSATQTIADWLMATGGDEGAKALLTRLDDAGDDGITVEAKGLPATVGHCVVSLRFADEEKRTLKITSTATFADSTETVSLTLTKGIPPNHFTDTLKTTDFATETYDARANELDTLAVDTPVRVGDPGALTTAQSAAANENDRKKLGASITSTDSNAEAWWTHTDLSAKGALQTHEDSAVLGTQSYALNLTESAQRNDTRRFVAPVNGRLLINPLETTGSHSTDNGYTATSATKENGETNTKLNSLAIDTSNAQTEDILLRLGAVNGATETRYNALLMLTFTDFTGKDATAVAGDGSTYTWHPNNWRNLDVYLRSDAGLSTNLLVGPFGHKFDDYLDTYWSWGNYVDAYHGTKRGEFGELWPYVSNSWHKKSEGLPLFPADYGNTKFWVLDGSTSNYFRILQGVNIFNGSVYSNRRTIIGGALIKTAEHGYTSDNVNSGTDGFAEAPNDYAAVYANGTTRYGQIIADTDIALMPPTSGTAASEIRRPQTYRDRVFEKNNIPAKDKEFNPTMTIRGGTIYVGERQSLTIQGSVLDNMWINPDQIVVAKGGTLIIEGSSYTNVLSDIYVDGGTLIIKAGAKIKGSVYAYNGGTVDIRGEFSLV